MYESKERRLIRILESNPTFGRYSMWMGWMGDGTEDLTDWRASTKIPKQS
jgi:hypothetical protein